jgi:FkbM family methyltransferase
MKIQLREFEFEVSGDPEFWKSVDLWEPETFDIVKRYADQSKSFIDVGAWNGAVSLYASHLFNNVVSIEPDVVAFDKLSHNINSNSCLNVTCRNVAISNRDGHDVLHLSNGGDSMSSLINRQTQVFPITGSQGTETKRFETIIEDSSVEIGLIKMDIEGGELIALPDMIQYLDKNKPPIYVSFHPFWFPENLKEIQIAMFAEMFFYAYPVVRDGQFNEVTKQQFIEGMQSNSFSYVFDTK